MNSHAHAAVRAPIGLEGRDPKELYLVEGPELYRGLAWNSPVGVPSLAIFHAPMIPSGGTALLAPSGAYAGSMAYTQPPGFVLASASIWGGKAGAGT